MKKILIGLLIIVLFLFAVLLIFDPNKELMFNEFKANFKSKCSINLSVNADELSMIEFQGGIAEDYYENLLCVEPLEMKNIINRINELSLVEADHSELASKSPDIWLRFVDKNGEIVEDIWIYGEIFIEDHKRGFLYRSKKGNIISTVLSGE